MPSGVITDRFVQQIVRLKATALAVALEATGTLDRVWHIPVPHEWNGDPLDIAGLALPFNRAELAELYVKTLTQPEGTGGDGMSLKVQHDHLAVQERSYRLRHLSPIRAVLHAGARRQGHGAETQGVFDRINQYAADLLVAGAAGWIAPQPPV